MILVILKLRCNIAKHGTTSFPNTVLYSPSVPFEEGQLSICSNHVPFCALAHVERDGSVGPMIIIPPHMHLPLNKPLPTSWVSCIPKCIVVKTSKGKGEGKRKNQRLSVSFRFERKRDTFFSLKQDFRLEICVLCQWKAWDLLVTLTFSLFVQYHIDLFIFHENLVNALPDPNAIHNKHTQIITESSTKTKTCQFFCFFVFFFRFDDEPLILLQWRCLFSYLSHFPGTIFPPSAGLTRD